MAIYWLGEPGCDDASVVGGKAANLSSLAGKYHVPHGFVVVGYQRDNMEVVDAYNELCIRVGVPGIKVAVRSSCTDEDGHVASFAGQHLTVLEVLTPSGVVKSVKRCRDSAYTDEVLAYRDYHNLKRPTKIMPVLVQVMVDAWLSAVVFSADPVTSDTSKVIIETTQGLGEGLVSGWKTPEHITKEKNRIHELTVRGRQLAKLAIMLEKDMGWPVDIECGFDKTDKLYLLQCRPITTLGKEAM